MSKKEGIRSLLLTSQSFFGSCIEFFSDEENFTELYDLINNQNKRDDTRLTITKLDKLITLDSCAKRPIVRDKHGNTIDIYQNYKTIFISGLSKRNFDPYCRSIRKCDYCERRKDKSTCAVCRGTKRFSDKFELKSKQSGRVLKTNITQMNFVRWSIETGFLKYAKKVVSKENSNIRTEPIKKRKKFR